MPINTTELLSVVSQLTENHHVKETIKKSVTGGIIAGITAGVGGILLGPVGLAVGGAVGGLSAYLMNKDKFKPISEVIKNMTNQQRERLAASVNAVIADLRVEDAALLLPLLLNSPGAKEAVLRAKELFLDYLSLKIKAL